MVRMMVRAFITGVEYLDLNAYICVSTKFFLGTLSFHPTVNVYLTPFSSRECEGDKEEGRLPSS